MIAFAPSKINIGLRIIDKRTDGFHNLDTYLYPIPLHDVLEVNEATQDSFEQTGIVATHDAASNLVMQALRLMRREVDIPPVAVHLHKQIPMQAGLGGGSSDAVSMLRLLQKPYAPHLDEAQMLKMALTLGSDCPFFLQKQAAHITGRGEHVKSIKLSLAGKYIALVKPPVAISTAAAFAQASPHKGMPLPNIMQQPLASWQAAYPNDFEQFLGDKEEPISSIKQQLIDKGAFYAALSGSGSTVFGLFHHDTPLHFPDNYFYRMLMLES